MYTASFKRTFEKHVKCVPRYYHIYKLRWLLSTLLLSTLDTNFKNSFKRGVFDHSKSISTSYGRQCRIMKSSDSPWSPIRQRRMPLHSPSILLTGPKKTTSNHNWRQSLPSMSELIMKTRRTGWYGPIKATVYLLTLLNSSFPSPKRTCPRRWSTAPRGQLGRAYCPRGA